VGITGKDSWMRSLVVTSNFVTNISATIPRSQEHNTYGSTGGRGEVLGQTGVAEA